MIKYTQLIILFEKPKLPIVEEICPSIWDLKNYTSSGDYYYDEIDGKWSNLELSTTDDNGLTNIYVWTNWRHPPYPPSPLEIQDLEFYLKLYDSGRYSVLKNFPNQISGVSNWTFKSGNQKLYEEFLNSVYLFLLNANGWIVNFNGSINASQFKDSLQK